MFGVIRAGRCLSRAYATNPARAITHPIKASDQITESSYARPAQQFSQQVGSDEKKDYGATSHNTMQQMRSPWTRADSDMPPAQKTTATSKGKLLTTPSRMLKLMLPLTQNSNVEPLALLVHPQQPLSYLERLIQAELPTIQDKTGRDKIPGVTFRALDMGDQEIKGDVMMVDGKLEHTGKLGDTSERHDKFVRWSPSTEMGDFIRDASKGGEFAVDIEKSTPLYVAVPTFHERTHYLRMRLRKAAKRISQLADLKKECDTLAHKSAKRVAQAGFGILLGWWYVVYRLTFGTNSPGWEYMEPVTYLVGLSTLIGGYMWFLYHNREVSYQSAMNLTISRRQSKLYAQRGFDLPTWEGLVEEGNRLRREIKMVAEEYDVEWDETHEGGTEKAAEALREERRKKRNKDDDDDDDEKKK